MKKRTDGKSVSSKSTAARPKAGADKGPAGYCRPEFLDAAEIVINDIAKAGKISADKKKGLLELIQHERESRQPKYGYIPRLVGFPDSVKKKAGPMMDEYGLQLIVGWRDGCNGNWRLLLIDMNDHLFCLSTHGPVLWRVTLSGSLDIYRGSRYGENTYCIQRSSWFNHWLKMLEHKLRFVEGLEAQRPAVKWLKGGV